MAAALASVVGSVVHGLLMFEPAVVTADGRVSVAHNAFLEATRASKVLTTRTLEGIGGCRPMRLAAPSVALVAGNTMYQPPPFDRPDLAPGRNRRRPVVPTALQELKAPVAPGVFHATIGTLYHAVRVFLRAVFCYSSTSTW